MRIRLLVKSFVETGVTNTGKVDTTILHFRLRAMLEGDEEAVNKDKDDEEATGLTDDEEDEEDEDDEYLEVTLN